MVIFKTNPFITWIKLQIIDIFNSEKNPLIFLYLRQLNHIIYTILAKILSPLQPIGTG